MIGGEGLKSFARKLPQYSMLKIIRFFRFTADVTCLDTLESGEVLVSGSADMTIKVTDTKSFSDKVLIGHSGPILSVSLDPRKKFVASSSCDGTVRVWEVGTKEQVGENSI